MISVARMCDKIQGALAKRQRHIIWWRSEYKRMAKKNRELRHQIAGLRAGAAAMRREQRAAERELRKRQLKLPLVVKRPRAETDAAVPQ